MWLKPSLTLPARSFISIILLHIQIDEHTDQNDQANNPPDGQRPVHKAFQQDGHPMGGTPSTLGVVRAARVLHALRSTSGSATQSLAT